MLKPMGTAPTDLGKQGEVTKHSPAFDRITLDAADLRVYTSNDGKRTYLRVWETGGKPGEDGAAWYEIVAAPAAAPDPANKK